MVDLTSIKELEENEDIDCDYTSDLVCPYCGYKNEPDSECDTEIFEESYETECVECEKHFMVVATCTINYSSEPIENYYLREIESITKNIQQYKHIIESEDLEDNTLQYFKSLISYKTIELNQFNKDFQQYFDDNSENN